MKLYHTLRGQNAARLFGAAIVFSAATAAAQDVPTAPQPPSAPAVPAAPSVPDAPVADAAPAPTEPAAPAAEANAEIALAPAAEPVPAEAPAEAAPEAKPSATIAAGYVEAAYHRNLSESQFDLAVPLRSYDAAGANSFLFHAAHLVVKHNLNDSVGVVVEFDAGTDALVNTGFYNIGGPFFFDVQEAYATYTGGGFTLTAGKFVTYEGIEIVEGPLNPTVTRGFLFGLAEPVGHTGAKLHYNAGAVDIGLGVVNGWDAVIDNNSDKTVIWRLAYTVPSFWAAFSGTYGAEAPPPAPPPGGPGPGPGVVGENDQLLSLDLTGAFTLNEMVTINFQGNYGRQQNVLANGDAGTFWGLGVQPNINLDDFSLGARLEYFSDTDATRAGNLDTKYFNFTIAPGYQIGGGFRIRAEYRLDTATEDVLNGDGTQSTVALAADYEF